MARTNERPERTSTRHTHLLHRLTAVAVVAGVTLGTPSILLAQSLHEIDFEASRGKIVAELAAVPSAQLRHVYLACSRESSQRLLEPGEAMVCTMVADTLLARDFHGDFTALLAWWQVQRDASVARELPATLR